jgi:hypothetical protein
VGLRRLPRKEEEPFLGQGLGSGLQGGPEGKARAPFQLPHVHPLLKPQPQHQGLFGVLQGGDGFLLGGLAQKPAGEGRARAPEGRRRGLPPGTARWRRALGASQNPARQ